jgi:hypothetical protein
VRLRGQIACENYLDGDNTAVLSSTDVVICWLNVDVHRSSIPTSQDESNEYNTVIQGVPILINRTLTREKRQESLIEVGVEKASLARDTANA